MRQNFFESHEETSVISIASDQVVPTGDGPAFGASLEKMDLGSAISEP
jgi:hypothetical protein